MKKQVLWLSVLCGLASLCVADPALEAHRSFLKTHCFECHGPEKQKGEFRFDTLGTDLSELQTLEAWQGILDQLNLGEMPPKKQPQPPFEEIAKVIQGLTPVLQRAYAERKSTGGAGCD